MSGIASRPLGAILVALGVLAAGCDPCSGVAACTGASRLSVEGRLFDERTGQPARGAIVDLIRTGGVALDFDSIRALANGDGSFTFAVAAAKEGVVVADITVRAASGGAYRVSGLRLSATRKRGEAVVLPTWSTKLSLPYLGQIFRRDAQRTLLAGTSVRFHQTGGPPLSGVADGDYSLVSDANGIFVPFPERLVPANAGDVVGDLTIELPGELRTVHRDVHFTVAPEFRPARKLRLFGAGPNLDYHFAVASRGAGTLMKGVRVEFRRTGGIDVTPASWSALTDGNGRVAFPARSVTYGTVTGDLRIIPAAPWKTYDRTSIKLTAFDADTAILYGVYGVGPGLPYFVRIRNNGALMKGVIVEFRATAGVSVGPNPAEFVTNDTGVVFMSTAPASEGEVVGDITVRPPAPLAGFTVRNVRMQAMDADPPGGWILLGDWDLSSPPAAASSVRSR